MSATYDDLTFERPGHATVRIETDEGTVIYIDPWADVLDGSPGDGDVVFVTHDDPDHYDPDGIAAVASPDVTVAVFEAIDTEDLEYDAISLPQEGTASVDGIEVETHPSYNEPDGEHVNDLGRPFHARGEVIGLVVTLDGTRIFYPSDTDALPTHESVSAAVLTPPIGGNYTMDRHQAADLARSIEPELVLPVHYDTFDAIETDASAFVEELRADGIEAELF
jgi:L-ascorbate metabolism protein UlaG (beta-lactamase superfamily)